MSDAILNKFVGSGTAAERAAFTPDPPTVAIGPDHLYLWYETDTSRLYAWDGAAWDLVGSVGGALGDVVGPGVAVDDNVATFDGVTGKLVQDGGKTIAQIEAAAAATAAGYTDSELAAHVGDADAHKGQKHSIEVDAGDLQLVGDDAAPGANQVYGTDGSGNKGWKADLTAALKGTIGAWLAAVDDVVFVECPYAGTITAARIAGFDATGASLSGDAVVDVWKDTLANYPPTVADTITASAKPTLSGDAIVSDTTLTGWTVAVAAGDWLAFKLESMTTIEKVLVQLTIARS